MLARTERSQATGFSTFIVKTGTIRTFINRAPCTVVWALFLTCYASLRDSDFSL